PLRSSSCCPKSLCLEQQTPCLQRALARRVHKASASRSSLKFSVAVSNCLLVSRTTTGSASLKKPRLSPLKFEVSRVPPSMASKVLSISRWNGPETVLVADRSFGTYSTYCEDDSKLRPKNLPT